MIFGENSTAYSERSIAGFLLVDLVETYFAPEAEQRERYQQLGFEKEYRDSPNLGPDDETFFLVRPIESIPGSSSSRIGWAPFVERTRVSSALSPVGCVTRGVPEISADAPTPLSEGLW